MSALARWFGVVSCREAAVSPAARRPCAKAEPMRHDDKYREREGREYRASRDATHRDFTLASIVVTESCGQPRPAL